MRTIYKNREPASLAQHRAATSSNYKNYADKDTLRNALVNEQRGICCYCMSRIHPLHDSMKIAHWHSQTRYPHEQLDYSNLLAACLGNEGNPHNQQHCDTHQGNQDISRNPAIPAHQVEHFTQFQIDGRIVSSDLRFDRDLNEVLNLNVAVLKNNRKQALEAFKQWLTRTQPNGWTRPVIERQLRVWNGESHPGAPLQPFCQVIVYWLRKRLARQ